MIENAFAELSSYKELVNISVLSKCRIPLHTVKIVTGGAALAGNVTELLGRLC